MIPMSTGPDLDQIAAEALRNVLVTRFKLHPVAVAPNAVPESDGDVLWLTGLMNLEGMHARGNVRLEISKTLLVRLDESLGGSTPDPPARESELADLAGELCNMVAGRIGAGLAAAGIIVTLGTPAVLRERGREAGNGVGKWDSHTDWTCAGGALILKVRIQ